MIYLVKHLNGLIRLKVILWLHQKSQHKSLQENGIKVSAPLLLLFWHSYDCFASDDYISKWCQCHVSLLSPLFILFIFREKKEKSSSLQSSQCLRPHLQTHGLWSWLVATSRAFRTASSSGSPISLNLTPATSLCCLDKYSNLRRISKFSRWSCSISQ
jgi:hypothetical protein